MNNKNLLFKVCANISVFIKTNLIIIAFKCFLMSSVVYFIVQILEYSVFLFETEIYEQMLLYYLMKYTMLRKKKERKVFFKQLFHHYFNYVKT